MIPQDGEVMFYGSASLIPSGWVVDSVTDEVFVRGSAAVSDVLAGNTWHDHTNPNTSTAPNHSHSLSGSVGAPSGDPVTVKDDYIHDNFARTTHVHTLSGSVSGASPAHTTSNTQGPTATTFPPYVRMYFIKATVDKVLPVRGVIMWSGTAATIPAGFFLCDGANNTPDLRNRFVLGASQDDHVGAVGGASTHVHSNANTGTVSTHTHTLTPTVGNSTGHFTGSIYNKPAAKEGHTHSASITSNSGGGHSHTLGNTGSASNLPPWYKLYYIMRGA